MKVNRRIPFFSNTPDNTHCFQSAIRMVLKYFFPQEKYSWKELDRISAKIEGKWTWPMAGVLWLQEKELSIRVYTTFDYELFSKKGETYLIKEYGEEIANEQVSHSKLTQELGFARRYVKDIPLITKIPTIDTIRRLLIKGYILICNVNSRALARKSGYVGHFVVVKGVDDKHIYFHNPGLPARRNQKVLFSHFEKGWAYPNKKAKNIIAIRKS